MSRRELCGDISPHGAMCVLHPQHRCRCAGPEIRGMCRERWWSFIKRPVRASEYVAQQVADWFVERRLVPCIIRDTYRLSVGDVRIHGSEPGRHQLKRICYRDTKGGMPLRRATLDDMRLWLPCDSCTAQRVHKIVTNRWPPERAAQVRQQLRRNA